MKSIRSPSTWPTRERQSRLALKPYLDAPTFGEFLFPPDRLSGLDGEQWVTSVARCVLRGLRYRHDYVLVATHSQPGGFRICSRQADVLESDLFVSRRVGASDVVVGLLRVISHVAYCTRRRRGDYPCRPSAAMLTLSTIGTTL